MLLAAQLSSAAFQRVNSAVGPPAERKRKGKRPGAGKGGGGGDGGGGGGGGGAAEASPCATTDETVEKSQHSAREVRLASERLARVKLG